MYSGVALRLGLPPFALETLAYGGPHVTQSTRHLPIPAPSGEEQAVWCEEHTDYNMLSIIPGARFFQPGEIKEFCPPPLDGGILPPAGLYHRGRPSQRHPEGEMLRGKPPEGCISAQVGQSLEVLTGGRYLATPFMIKAITGYERCSVQHFCHVRLTETLFPLPELADDAAVRTYSPPVLAGTYSTMNLVDIGLAPSTALGLEGRSDNRAHSTKNAHAVPDKWSETPCPEIAEIEVVTALPTTGPSTGTPAPLPLPPFTRSSDVAPRAQYPSSAPLPRRRVPPPLLVERGARGSM